MLYPTISDWWNSKVQSQAVADYNETVAKMDTSDAERMLAEAREYNEKLSKLTAPFSYYDQIPGYEDILNVSGSGIMGYVSIPQISVELPIYHGTGAEVLNVAVGHYQGSSLPVGGENTHAVISAHRGLPSARLFTDIDKLVVGDTFTITVLNEVLTYEVDRIRTVLPDKIDELAIIPGGDYVTLMTCTPYGINTHRLLVRAHRIDTINGSSVKVTADAVQVDPMLVVPLISAPLVLILICFWIFGGKNNKRRRKINISRIISKDGDQ